VPNRLKNKVVVITGSSRGLGKIIAERFLEEGSRVVINGRNPDELNEAENELKKVSENVLKFSADITKEDQVTGLVEKVLRKSGQIDILINNAGVFKAGEVDKFSLEDFRLSMDINVVGAFFNYQTHCASDEKTKIGTDHKYMFHRVQNRTGEPLRILCFQSRPGYVRGEPESGIKTL